MNFKKWVKSIQTAAYNGAGTVYKKEFQKHRKEILPWLFNISPPVSSPVTEAAVAELEGSLSFEVTERLTDAAGLRSNKLTLRLKLANSPI
jgi:hypothetical protein